MQSFSLLDGTVLIGYYDYLGTRPKNSHRAIILQSGLQQADPDSPVTVRQLMSHALHFLMRASHPTAAETALVPGT